MKPRQERREEENKKLYNKYSNNTSKIYIELAKSVMKDCIWFLNVVGIDNHKNQHKVAQKEVIKRLKDKNLDITKFKKEIKDKGRKWWDIKDITHSVEPEYSYLRYYESLEIRIRTYDDFVDFKESGQTLEDYILLSAIKKGYSKLDKLCEDEKK